MRYNNVEFRSNITKNRSPEIVAWMKRDEKETCYTICWFQQDKESWYIKTVGDRFTEYEDSSALMHVAKYALRVLNTEMEFNEGL